jgi:hypothetical protein
MATYRSSTAGRAVTDDLGTVTRTIRVDRQVDDLLRRLSSQERVSVNHLVNRSLRKFVEWDNYADKFGVVSMPTAMVLRMMDSLSEEQARELGVWVGRNLVREFLTFWFKEVSVQNVLTEYPRLAALYGRAFEYEERQEDGRWIIVLKHGAGPKWSIFYGALLRALFEDVARQDAAIEETENQVVARFSLAPDMVVSMH